MSTTLSPNVPPTCSIEPAAMRWIPSRQIKADPCEEVASLIGLRKCDEAGEKFGLIPDRAYSSLSCSYHELLEGLTKCFEENLRAAVKTADPCEEVRRLVGLRKCGEALKRAFSVPEKAIPFLSCSRHELLESVTKCSKEEAAVDDWRREALLLSSKVYVAALTICATLCWIGYVYMSPPSQSVHLFVG